MLGKRGHYLGASCRRRPSARGTLLPFLKDQRSVWGTFTAGDLCYKFIRSWVEMRVRLRRFDGRENSNLAPPCSRGAAGGRISGVRSEADWPRVRHLLRDCPASWEAQALRGQKTYF